jgi:hypothetical protein
MLRQIFNAELAETTPSESETIRSPKFLTTDFTDLTDAANSIRVIV